MRNLLRGIFVFVVGVFLFAVFPIGVSSKEKKAYDTELYYWRNQ